MNWKYNNKKRMCEEESDQQNYQPIIINSSSPDFTPQIMGGNIRVVENKIFFYGEIDEDTVLDLNKTLLETDIKLQNTKNILGEDSFMPIIHLHVSTYGGSIFAAFAAVDTIRNLKAKVYTYVDGSVASAGTLLTAIGHKRYIGQYGHMLIHQLSSGVYGKFSEMEDEIFNCTNLMKILKDYYKKTTKMPMKKLDELLKRDIWLNAEECVQYGFVDEIL